MSEIEPCDDMTQNHDWVLSETTCDSCGGHDGYSCRTCYEFVDQFNDESDFNRIKAAIEESK